MCDPAYYRLNQSWDHRWQINQNYYTITLDMYCDQSLSTIVITTMKIYPLLLFWWIVGRPPFPTTYRSHVEFRSEKIKNDQKQRRKKNELMFAHWEWNDILFFLGRGESSKNVNLKFENKIISRCMGNTSVEYTLARTCHSCIKHFVFLFW